jgi:acyl transferase domain-containing protein
MNSNEHNPIAIISAACRFPGNVSNIEEYWEFLKNGEDAVTETPPERWSWRYHYDKNPDMPGKVYVKRGSYMNIDIEAFDAAFFDISPREASVLDPQQRLLLEVCFEALEGAVGDVNTLQGSNTGVYIGCFMQDNMHTQSGPGAKTQVSLHTAVSSTMTMVSNRLSYTFDLKGPSFTLDTACSSSLVAVHQACLGLRVGDCDMALAGGVNVMFRPEPNIMMCKGHFLAADGRSKTFSAHADGYGRGEGAGIVVLKRLQDAISDGDTIQGVILSSGVNQDGSTEGITVPSETSQIALARKVYQDGNIDPRDITYLEAHGTGTPVGDPIEMRAMGTVISREHHAQDEPLIVGSVKAGIGHLEAAAGIAGLLKAMLVAKNGHIPPQAWLDTELNPAIDFDGLNIRIADKYQPLPKSKVNGRSYIAVNSFGYGGTNAHAVIGPYDQSITNSAKTGTVEPAQQKYCLFLSGASESACEAYAKLFLERIADASDDDVLNICQNAIRKTSLAFRWVINASSAAELKEKLSDTVNGIRVVGVIKGRANSKQQPVFVFSGMGPQWWAMGQQLFQTEPVYARAVTEADKLFQELAGWSILAEMLRNEDESKMAETAIAQAANFIVQMGVFELLASWGIKPAAVVGHSVGEVSSAYASGVLSLRDAITVSYHRGRTQAKTAGTGSMLATGLSLADAEQMITAYEGKVSIAGINSPTNCTLSGDEACIDIISAQLESQGVFSRKLRVEVPYHSAGMDPILDELRSSLNTLRPGAYQTPLYSTVTGKLAAEGEFGDDYWCDNVRNPVLFKDAIESILADGYETLLEICPHPVLTGYVKEIMAVSGNKGVCLNTLKRKEDESAQLWEAVAGLWVNGVSWDIQHYLGAFTHKLVLPAYPWQRKTHWREDKNERLKRQGWPDAHVLLGHRTTDPIPTWHSELTGAIVPWLEAHRVGQQTVFPGAGYLDVLIAVLQEQNQLLSEKALRNLHFHRAMVMPEGEWLAMKTILDNSGKLSVYAGIASRIDEWTLHASAEFISGKFSPPSSDPSKALKLDAFEDVDVEQLYLKLNSLGLDYGKTATISSILPCWMGHFKPCWR